MTKLFGFSIEDNEPLSPTAVSPVPPNDEDGVDHYMSSGFFGSYVDLEGVYRTEFELIKRYREMALHPECDSAIEDIINEAIVSDSNDSPVEIDLNHLNASDGIKKKIRDEVKNVKDLFTYNFDKKIDVEYPFTGEVIGTVPAGNAEHAKNALEIAANYTPKLTRYERQKILQNAAEELVNRKEQISDLITYELGIS